MIKFRIKKSTRMTASMLSSACFIALAVWGWGLTIETVLAFLVICLGFLLLIVGSAALLGWVMNRLRNRQPNQNE